LKTTKNITRETAPESFALIVKGSPHDYGTYYEVAARYNDNDEVACDLAYEVEEISPLHWDEEALKELGLVKAN
jgi:hypothetical protein